MLKLRVLWKYVRWRFKKKKTYYSGGFFSQDLELEPLLLGRSNSASGVIRMEQLLILRLQADGIAELTVYRENRI
jgi:hypothetical protein